jgi:hypothetical protein
MKMIGETFLNEIQQHLLNGENVLWSGKSDNKKIFTIEDILLIPFSYIFLIVALFMELIGLIMLFDPEGSLQKNSSRGLGGVLSLIGIIFILCMYYLAIGRFIVKKRYKENVIYVVTDKRVLILSNYGKRKKVIEESINEISNIYISVNKSGNGTLKFGEINSPNKFLINAPLIEALMFPIEEIPVFYDIDDAEKVYTLVNSKMNTK